MDKYIDNLETQNYGLRLSANLRRIFTEASPIQIFMGWCADQLDVSTQTMNMALAARRSASSERTMTAEEKIPAVQAGRNDLRAFQMHLQAKKADIEDNWNGDVELFVPNGIRSVGRGVRAVRAGLSTARARLADDKSVPDRARWIKRLDAQIEALTPMVDQADDVTYAHQNALSEQSIEKRNWLRTYRAVAKILEGCLLLTGRQDEYTAAVPHLTAPGARKKTDGAPNAPKKPEDFTRVLNRTNPG